jgi:hypothetical protein
MKKADLANDLRSRQLANGYVSAKLLANITDDQLIDSYITCSGCGKRAISPSDLPSTITAATSTDDFLDAVAARHKH